MKKNRFSAIILAAGCSSRMGAFKPLLPVGGQTVIERAIGIFKKSGIETIFVVTGYRAPEIKRSVQSSDVRIVLGFRTCRDTKRLGAALGAPMPK